MANAWDVTDAQLQRELTAILADEAGDSDWNVHLYGNDYTPVPGSVIGDYTEADFPGYLPAPLITADWGAVSVTDHVAISIHDTPSVFEADPSGFLDFAVFGYYVTNGDDEYVYGERFATTQIVLPSGILSVACERRHGVTPAA